MPVAQPGVDSGRPQRQDERIAELEAELAASRRELHALARRLVQVQEDERRALARDLHDTSGEAMTVIGLGLTMLQREAGLSDKSLKRVEDLRGMAATVGEDLHRLSVNLRPSSLDRYGLVPAIEELLRTLQQQTGAEVDFAADGLAGRMPGEMETALYRVVQEACTNIARYATASHVTVRLSREDGTVRAFVADDGRGFDVEAALESGRLGLLGMRERAEMFGGAFEIESRPGQGTRLWIAAPLPDVGPPDAAPADRRAPTASLDGVAQGRSAALEHLALLSEAAELARGKALSDALVDILAGMVRQADARGLLDFVLTASAEAIGCDHAYVGLREAGEWCIRHGYRLAAEMIDRRLPDADVPLAVSVERTGKSVVLDDLACGELPRGLTVDLGAHAAAGVPLIAGGEFLGVVVYFHTSIQDAFRPSEVAFLDRLAALISLSLENMQLQAARAQSDARYRQLFEAIDDSFALVKVLYDDAGRPADLQFIDVNEQAAERAGLPREQMVGKRVSELGAPVEPRRLEICARVAATGRPVRHADRSHFTDTWYEMYVYSPGQDLVALLGHDVTEQRRADEQLRRSEAIYRTIAASFPEGVIYVFDRDLRYLVVEGEGLALFGQTPEALEGKTLWETLDPDTAALIEPRYRRTLAGEALHFETQHGPQFGSRVISADYRPIRDAAGQITAGLLVARDLTERSRLLAQLQGQIAELDGILAALPSGLIVYDPAGQIIRMNDLARNMLAYDPDTWQRPVGERVTTAVQLSRPDGAPLAAAEYPAIRALHGEEVRNASYFLHLPAHPERDFWVMLSASPLHGPGVELLGAALTLTDVTDLYETRVKLQEANAALLQQASDLREAKEGLEQRVQERTAELAVLIEQMEGNRLQLRALSRRLVEMQETERSYVADQLYNQAAQVLAAVRMQLWLLEKHAGAAPPAGDAPDLLTTTPAGEAIPAATGPMEGMKDALDRTILALHDLATQLRPAGLDRATLTRVLGDYVARTLSTQGVAFQFEGGNTEKLRVSREVVTAVFRTVQEALSNIVRHSAATSVQLTMHHGRGRLTVTLADDGIGFNADSHAIDSGVGLIAMRERIESVGGRLTVISAPGGTTIRMEVPVEQDDIPAHAPSP